MNGRPHQTDLKDLKASDAMGLAYVLGVGAFTALALYLSTSPVTGIWLAGQALLSIALVQWFILLHEAGHRTLFASRWPHAVVGHIAGYFAIIPFASWRFIHQRHHVWTGWQDLDATTAALVGERSRPERLLVNICWLLWIPLFSVLYRTGNYWNVPRMFRILRQSGKRRRILIDLTLLLAAYAVTAALVGPTRLLRLVGLGVFGHLVLEDLLLLSQHTHIPMERAEGRSVKPFISFDQEVFTRSLTFPTWFSRFVLVGVDAHELHHMYPAVPGYHLHRIDYTPVNAISWWRWLYLAKKLPGEIFLFSNRHETGVPV